MFLKSKVSFGLNHICSWLIWCYLAISVAAVVVHPDEEIYAQKAGMRIPTANSPSPDRAMELHPFPLARRSSPVHSTPRRKTRIRRRGSTGKSKSSKIKTPKKSSPKKGDEGCTDDEDDDCEDDDVGTRTKSRDDDDEDEGQLAASDSPQSSGSCDYT